MTNKRFSNTLKRLATHSDPSLTLKAMIENYHTHHNFCGHAEGYAWDYVEEAIKLGFSVLGISDHAPNKLINDWGVRMKESQLDEYLADIESARKKAGKKITVLSGLEVEYFPNNEEYYEKEGNENVTSFGKRWIDYAPVIEIAEDEIIDQLKTMFGELWVPIFKQWFTDTFSLPVKTVEF